MMRNRLNSKQKKATRATRSVMAQRSPDRAPFLRADFFYAAAFAFPPGKPAAPDE